MDEIIGGIMEVKSVTIEGMHNATIKHYDLGSLSYLYGKNGSGKTTVMQAVQLALLGYIPGTNKRTSDIFEHSNGHSMSVSVVISNGTSDIKIRRSWMKKGSSVVSTVDTFPKDIKIEEVLRDIELPIFNFNEFMTMTPNKMKDWFIRFLPSVSKEFDWKTYLESNVPDGCSISDELSFNMEEAYKYPSTIEGVQSMNSFIKSLISFKKSEASRLTSSIQSMVYYDDFDEAVDVEEISRNIKDINEAIDAHRRYIEVKNRKEYFESQLRSYDDVRDYKITEIDHMICDAESTYDREIERITDTIGMKSEEADSLRSEISYMSKVVQSKGVCPYTSDRCESIALKAEDYSERLKNIKYTYEALVQEISVLKNEISELQRARNNKLNRFNDIKSKLQRRMLILEQITSIEIDESASGVDEVFLRSEVDRLQNILMKAEVNKKYQSLIDKVSHDKFAVESDIDILKHWDKLTDANGLQNEMMVAPFIDLESDMNKYLEVLYQDSKVRCKFNLEAKSNSFNFGVDRDGAYIPFNLLSSGEKCIYTLALMLCISSRSKSDLKLVMIDDLLDHLDDDKSKMLFDSMSHVKGIQIILAGVKHFSSDFTKYVLNI